MELRLGDSPMGPVSLELCQVLMLGGTSGHATSTDLTPYIEKIRSTVLFGLPDWTKSRSFILRFGFAP